MSKVAERDVKPCPTCKAHLPVDAFHKNASRPDGRNAVCKACAKASRPRCTAREKAYRREYYDRNADALREKSREDQKRRRETDPVNHYAKKVAYYTDLRLGALNALGPVCVRCGFKDVRALQVDHVHGGGTQDRRARARWSYYRTIIEQAASGDFQVLCANCNWIKRCESEGERTRLRPVPIP